MHKTPHFIAALALLFGAASSQATVYNLGPLSQTPVTQTVVVAPGSFSDIFNFSIPTSTLSAAALTVALPGFYNINSFAGTVFNSSNVAQGSLVFNATYKDYVLTGSFSSGSYSLDINGHANGPIGGLYVVTLAVPEPSTVWTSLAGLGVLGLVMLWRRRRSDGDAGAMALAVS